MAPPFEAMMEFALLEGIKIILLGDFNIDLNLNNYESKKWMNLMCSNISEC